VSLLCGRYSRACLLSQCFGWDRGPSSQPVRPNQRLQLALPPIGDRPLAVLRGGRLDDGEDKPVALVRLTPALLRGAAETRTR
jgi:hypothetical protein